MSSTCQFFTDPLLLVSPSTGNNTDVALCGFHNNSDTRNVPTSSFVPFSTIAVTVPCTSCTSAWCWADSTKHPALSHDKESDVKVLLDRHDRQAPICMEALSPMESSKVRHINCMSCSWYQGTVALQFSICVGRLIRSYGVYFLMTTILWILCSIWSKLYEIHGIS